MILWRVLPWDPRAAPAEPGGALWFPRSLQGRGRHDGPELYGCLYVGEAPVSAVAEALARFRGAGVLDAEMLVRGGRPLALAQLELRDDAVLLDLDDPALLDRERLRPSEVATGHRPVTQAWAARLFAEHPEAAGLRWWSAVEASWINVTLFDRAAADLRAADVQPLTRADPAVAAAAELLGLPTDGPRRAR